MEQHKYVAYYRVSTKKQGHSGLGLKSQEYQVKQYVQKENGMLIEEFIEIDSGKNRDRPKLEKAFLLAKQKEAVLIIAKLDRLARDVEFIFSLKNSGIKFKALDIPEFNTLNVGIFATMAQYEHERISERTKRALEVKKKCGIPLGNPHNLTNYSREKSLQIRRKNSQEHSKKIYGIVSDLRNAGKTYKEIACRLNECGLRTVRGKIFLPMTVKRIFDCWKLKYESSTV